MVLPALGDTDVGALVNHLGTDYYHAIVDQLPAVVREHVVHKILFFFLLQFQLGYYFPVFDALLSGFEDDLVDITDVLVRFVGLVFSVFVKKVV